MLCFPFLLIGLRRSSIPWDGESFSGLLPQRSDDHRPWVDAHPVASLCGFAQWCSGTEWSVLAVSAVNSLLSQLHGPKGSFWVDSWVPVISSPWSRLVSLS